MKRWTHVSLYLLFALSPQLGLSQSESFVRKYNAVALYDSEIEDYSDFSEGLFLITFNAEETNDVVLYTNGSKQDRYYTYSCCESGSNDNGVTYEYLKALNSKGSEFVITLYSREDGTSFVRFIFSNGSYIEYYNKP